MTAFSDIADRLGWDNTELARRLECERRTISRWYYGEAECPPDVIRWARETVEAIERVHEPVWRVRS